MHAALFVYGTLMPGRLRWAMLAGGARRHEAATVPGVLYDTGHGWPAADLSAALEPERAVTLDRVPGSLVHLRVQDLEQVLARLDAMEGIASPPDPATDPYARVAITVTSAVGEVRAWAYHATIVDPGWRRIARWEGIAEH